MDLKIIINAWNSNCSKVFCGTLFSRNTITEHFCYFGFGLSGTVVGLVPSGMSVSLYAICGCGRARSYLSLPFCLYGTLNSSFNVTNNI